MNIAHLSNGNTMMKVLLSLKEEPTFQVITKETNFFTLQVTPGQVDSPAHECECKSSKMTKIFVPFSNWKMKPVMLPLDSTSRPLQKAVSLTTPWWPISWKVMPSTCTSKMLTYIAFILTTSDLIKTNAETLWTKKTWMQSSSKIRSLFVLDLPSLNRLLKTWWTRSCSIKPPLFNNNMHKHMTKPVNTTVREHANNLVLIHCLEIPKLPPQENHQSLSNNEMVHIICQWGSFSLDRVNGLSEFLSLYPNFQFCCLLLWAP